MQRIVIDLYDHTSEDEVNEIIETLRGVGIDKVRHVNLGDMQQGYSELGSQAREKVWKATRQTGDLGGVSLTQVEVEALWTTVMKDARSVVSLKG